VSLPNDYKLLFQFIDKYLPLGFNGIDRQDPLLQEINTMMKKNKQFFYVADMVEMKIMYTCSAIKQMLGIEVPEFDPHSQFEMTHPDDMLRHNVSRSKMVRIANELYISGEDYRIMSTNLRFKHNDGHYINCLVQAYNFSHKYPKQSVYSLFIKTDINWFGPIKNGYNYYVGKDKSYFRLPDKELIETGNIFTDREFEIIDLIRQGFDSKTIGEKLFISSHTVDTHRRNILKKTNYQNTSELIIDLQERGFF